MTGVAELINYYYKHKRFWQYDLQRPDSLWRFLERYKLNGK
jgi:hypothetical protein